MVKDAVVTDAIVALFERTDKLVLNHPWRFVCADREGEILELVLRKCRILFPLF